MKKEELFETIGEIDESLAASALTEGRQIGRASCRERV